MQEKLIISRLKSSAFRPKPIRGHIALTGNAGQVNLSDLPIGISLSKTVKAPGIVLPIIRLPSNSGQIENLYLEAVAEPLI
jgi:hypothetical protein